MHTCCPACTIFLTQCSAFSISHPSRWPARVDVGGAPSDTPNEGDGDQADDYGDGDGDADADDTTEDDDIWEEEDREREGSVDESAESIFSKMERVRAELERDLGFDKFLEA